MFSSYINGIGIISRTGCNTKDIYSNILSNNITDIQPFAIEYTSVFEKSELRRISRYAKLSMEVSALSLIDANFKDFRNKHNENMGIIFTTGFGASEMNIKFFKSVTKKEPDFCSPLTFASTVPNYALGNVCISLGIKGYSTTLLGGNPFDLVETIMFNNRATELIVGAEEEYCADIFEAIQSRRVLSTNTLSEGTVAFYISKNRSETSYCKVVSSLSCALDKNPLFYNDVFESSKTDIIETINDCIGNEKVSTVFGIGETFNFGKHEKNLLIEMFPNAQYYGISRNVFGETLGSSFSMNVALASIFIKNNHSNICDNPINDSVLVTGIDIHGNYMCVLLKA